MEKGRNWRGIGDNEEEEVKIEESEEKENPPSQTEKDDTGVDECEKERRAYPTPTVNKRFFLVYTKKYTTMHEKPGIW